MDRRERLLGAATVVLVISLWMPWYRVGSFSVDGLSVHGWLFIAVVNSIVLILYVLVTAFGVGDLAVPGGASKDQLLAILTGVNLVVVVLCALLRPAGFGWAWGAPLAVVAAVVACAPYGVPFAKERRRR